MAAFFARMILGAGQRRVSNNVANDLRQLVNVVLDFVDVDTHVVGLLLVVAIPTRVQQPPVVLVLFRVQHVVALLTEFDADKCRTIRRHFDSNRTG